MPCLEPDLHHGLCERSTEPIPVQHTQALKYAKAAASVRACAVKLAVTPKGKLNAAVPYVGGALEGLIVELLRTGTCVQLEQFRCGRESISKFSWCPAARARPSRGSAGFACPAITP